jgi:hypothetical protein
VRKDWELRLLPWIEMIQKRRRAILFIIYSILCLLLLMEPLRGSFNNSKFIYYWWNPSGVHGIILNSFMICGLVLVEPLRGSIDNARVIIVYYWWNPSGVLLTMAETLLPIIGGTPPGYSCQPKLWG